MEVTEENDEKQLEPNRILKRLLPLYLFYCWRNLNSCRIPCYVQWSNKMLSKIYQWVWYSAYGLHKPNFPSLVFVFVPFSSGLSWWRSYQNWGSFMIQTPWSSWPGLGRRIHPRSQIQSAHHIEANLIRLFLRIEFHRASCPWLVRVSVSVCVHACVSALVCRRVCLMSDESWWISMNKTWECWKGPSCWQSSNPPQGLCCRASDQEHHPDGIRDGAVIWKCSELSLMLLCVCTSVHACHFLVVMLDAQRSIGRP